MTAETLLIGLAEWSIRAGILAGAAGLLLVALRIQDAHVRLTAWTLVLAGALLAPLATPFTRPLAITLPAWPWRSQERAAQPYGNTIPRVFERSRDTRSVSAIPAGDRGRWWAEGAVALWLGVALAMLLRLALGLRLSRRLASGSAVIEAGLRESPWVHVPITVGLFRPIILLPADWREWSPDKLRAVIAHERSHVFRRDPLRLFVASIYRSLAWFHPLVWWLHGHLAALAEAASDDIAIAAVQDPVGYAETLVGFLRNAPNRVRWEGVAMGSPSRRARRVERVLDSNRKLSRPVSFGMLAALMAGLLPFVYLAASARVVWGQAPTPAASSAASPSTSVCGGSPVHLAWLNSDVLYIITGDERRAFERLGTQEECGQFVEQFWLRRDPTPGTPENEYKEEHYRRIAYANQHFAGKLPGWKTDRGRTYITYGPPDEIESHPAGQAGGGTTKTFPFEQWRYARIEGVGDNIVCEFIDRSLDGDYRMTFMAGPAQRAALEGRANVDDYSFGPVDGISLRVNPDRTLLITFPQKPGARSVTLHIRNRDGSEAAFGPSELTEANGLSFNEATTLKWAATPLPAGSYTLVVEFNLMNPYPPADGNRRELPFEVK